MLANGFEKLVAEMRACRICADQLPLGPRPVFQIHPMAKILVAAQAPGRRVHETGLPFNDPSGDRLRAWLGVDRETFYNPLKLAIVPMGFCYPGTGISGDLPPRPECTVAWRNRALAILHDLELTLVIGQYSHDWHLRGKSEGTLTETVQNWKSYWPKILPLPHPSPRNNLWFKKNPWFEREILPVLKARVGELLNV